MKQVILSLVFIFAGVLSFGQSREDYETAMGSFKKLYNDKNVGGIEMMYSKKADNEEIKNMWSDEKMKAMREKYGALKEYKYIGDRNDSKPANLYKMEFEKSTEVIGVYLDSEGKILTFNFEKSSPTMERLLRSN